MNGASGTSTPRSHTALTRPLALVHAPSQCKVSIAVSSAHDDWVAAEVLRESFAALDDPNAVGLDGAAGAPLNDNDDDDDAEERAKESDERQLALAAHFLKHVAERTEIGSDTALHTGQVLASSFAFFHARFLPQRDNDDVHSLAAALMPDVRKLVLAAYFLARSRLQQLGEHVPVAKSALLEHAGDDVQLYALFGGQGMNEVYFDELQTLYDLYRPLLSTFLSQASAALSELASREQRATQLYTHGLDALSWLDDSHSRPPVAYLASCAVSLPLIGLTQLAQYVVLGRALDLTPHQLSSKFAGATGHSQGVVAACVVATRYLPDAGWDAFFERATDALEFLFQIGLQGSIVAPPLSVSPAESARSVELGDGVPSAMLAVTGLAHAALSKQIELASAATNGAASSLMISLFNGPKAFVVTGTPRDLVGLTDSLRKIRAEPGKDQSKIPHSKRLPVFSMRFLPIGVPYHSKLLEGATERLVAALDVSKWRASDLACAVYHTEDGTDLRESQELARALADQIFTKELHWATKATAFPDTATHAIDFGTGGASGIGSLSIRNWEGRGIRVAMLGHRGTGSNGPGTEVWTPASIRREQRWDDVYRPKLVRTSDGRVHIDTPMSRLLAKPPLMVAGMTPTTVKGGFVSAVLNAGYHIELAGGGHYNAKALRAKVDEIVSKTAPGVGVTLNSLYINQRQWTFQVPLWQEMKKEGLPIEGLCCAAGIPSTEKARELIDGLRSAGIKHVSFKPGSVEGIRQVVAIAAANPDYPIIMQWTGGRAGGHHSCEDFHAPILSTYASIRQQRNLVLVAGSGFGGADDTYPYLSGQWSVEQFGVQPMPFDGFLFASRVMVAKEAHTSETVKQLIVDAAGVPDGQWEQTYDKPTGGIITVTSELGEPIHKVATRGVKLWKEFDDTVFKMPRDKQAKWLQEKKRYVIDRLNADFQRPWFGAKADGTPCDLDDMTYAEVNARLVRLMYVAHERRWIDVSLRNLVGDWIRRVEERLSNVNRESLKTSILQSFAELEDPQAFLAKFLDAYPAAQDQILASADVAYFLAIAQRPGQKPVPFIPVLDQSFSIWFKKDSLWQSEDIEAVFDQDPQRVCILQGPVAVRYSKTTQQPVKELLGGIEQELTQRLLDDFYGGKLDNVPTIDYLAPAPPTRPADELCAEHHIAHQVQDGADGGQKHVYMINGMLPPTGDWMRELAGPKLNWLQAFLSQISVVQGKATVANPVSRVLAPRHGQRVELSLDAEGEPTKLEVFGGV